jgi:membrane protease YdiL (CAAX protease family)
MAIQESFLSRRPIIAILVLEVFNIIIGFGDRFLVDTLGADMVTGFLIRFSIKTVFFLIVVPLFLLVPNGQRTFKEYIHDIGLRNYRPLAKNLIITLVSILLLLFGFLFAAILYGNFVFDLAIIHPDNSPILFVAINAGLWEEIMWRGIILTLLLKRFDTRSAIALDTVFFALAHLMNLVVGQNPVVMLGQLIFVIIGAPFLAYVFIQTKSLWPGILIHFSIDAFGILFYNSLLQIGPNLVSGGIYMLMGWLLGNILAFIALVTITRNNKRYPEASQ